MRKLFNHKLYLALLFVIIIILMYKIYNLFAGMRTESVNTDNPTSKLGISQIEPHLTERRWNISISDGAASYTFYPDGIFTSVYFTDGESSSSGQWSLAKDENGSTHLILKTKTSSCYPLPCNTIIGYNPKSDNLLISGPNILGIQELKHISR